MTKVVKVKTTTLLQLLSQKKLFLKYFLNLADV